MPTPTVPTSAVTTPASVTPAPTTPAVTTRAPTTRSAVTPAAVTPITGTRTRRTVDQALAEARAGLVRLDPEQARAAQQAGALLVDIRPEADIAAEGTIPGALILHRNYLEWRFDPAGDAALPEADYDLQVVVLCNEGYTSSLAAAALQDLGVTRATDLDGGYRAWKAAGLPTNPAAG